jgi:hypothetical protein
MSDESVDVYVAQAAMAIDAVTDQLEMLRRAVERVEGSLVEAADFLREQAAEQKKGRDE